MSAPVREKDYWVTVCAACKKAVKVRRLQLRREVVLVRQRGYWRKHRARYNAARRPYDKRYQHDYGTKYVGIGCRPPTCGRCGCVVLFSGRGRSRLECPKCRAEIKAEIEAARRPWGGRRGIYVAWGSSG